MDGRILDKLFSTIEQRRKNSGTNSWTAKLFEEAPALPAKKLGEEASEVIIAAMTGDKDELVHESADLIYHLLVILSASDVPLTAVWKELERRQGISGLDEKANRS